jgi:hypothetical protein
MMYRLTDESVCPTLLSWDWQASGAGAVACQPIPSQLLILGLRERSRNRIESDGPRPGLELAGTTARATGLANPEIEI